MSACTPQAAPPVTTAIVTRSPIVRVVRIMFAPWVRTRPGHIGPRFSFGFPLTGDFRTHHYLNGKAESGRHGGPRDRRALPERREPPVLDVGLIIGALVLVLVILMAYQRYVAGKKPVQHLCDYCGHMVTAVSDCHHAPVRERFLHGTCLECKQDCRLVCARCKNPL